MKTNGARSVHVLLCGNGGYFQHIATCLVSILSTNPDLFLKVVVLATSATNHDKAKLRRSLESFGNIELSVVDFDARAIADLPLSAHYPAEIYARFWVADHFPADVDRVLYIDGDIIVTGSIKDLIDTELNDNILAAVPIPDSGRPELFGYDPQFGYFNSGVMLINLAEWRRIDARSILIAKAHEMAGKLKDPDQDVLNICFHRRWVRLDYVWNAISPFFKEVTSLKLPQSEIARVAREARVVHFNGLSKPWNYLCFHPHAAGYWRYLKQTEWRDFRPADFSLRNLFKKQLIRLLGERRAGLLSASARRLLRPSSSPA